VMKKGLIVVLHVRRIAMEKNAKQELIVGVVSVIQKKYVQVNVDTLKIVKYADGLFQYQHVSTMLRTAMKKVWTVVDFVL